MTGSAKQPSFVREVGLLRRFAPRNDDSSLFETVDQKPNKWTVVAGGWNCPVSGVFRG
jgi:hypothetical protein